MSKSKISWGERLIETKVDLSLKGVVLSQDAKLIDTLSVCASEPSSVLVFPARFELFAAALEDPVLLLLGSSC